MEEEKRELKGARELHRKAQERLKEKPALPEKLSELGTQELIQELRVHQIELEMQNEELRRTQAVVEESRAKYSDLYDFAPVGYLTLNRQGIILEANLTACSSLGEERSLLINIKNLFTKFIIKKVEKDLFYQHLGKVFEVKSLETCELELKGKGDTKFYAQLQSIVVKDNLSQCRTAIIDITERKEVNEKLQTSETRYRRLFEAAKDGILILDADSGKITDVNPFLEKLTDYSHEELLGKELWELGIFKDIVNSKEVFLELQSKGYIRYEDLPLQDKNGRKIDVEFVSNAYMVGHKKVIQCNIRDIADRKKAEAALMETVKAKSAFTNMVSHELRTPLSALKESVSQILEGMLGTINDDQRKFLEIAKRNVDRLARLITEVLDFQTLEIGKMAFKIQDNDINEVVKETEETMNIITKEKWLDFILNLDKGLPKIKFDRDKISQVLSNLVNNSLKLTEKGNITISTTKGNNVIQVSIKDTGPGIKEEDMPRLFQQYEQLERKTGGTGLGLAVSLEIIKAHGGKIWAESTFGHGTTMHFLLPIEERLRRA